MKNIVDQINLESYANDELKRFKDLYVILAETAPVGVLQANESLETNYVNQQWLSLCDLTEEDVQGFNWANILHDDTKIVIDEVFDRLCKGEDFITDCQILNKDEQFIWLQFIAKPILDDHQQFKGFLALLVDNTHYLTSESKLKEIAEQDDLTKLPNRGSLMARLSDAIQRIKKQGALSLLSLDLDGFKNINDSLGHDAGDKLLIEVSDRIKKVLRNTDFLARLGGDEFIIILERIPDAEIASIIAEKILQTLSQPFIISRQEVFVSASIGICFAVSGNKPSVQTLLKQADMALYRAKENGRNNYQYYTPELDAISRKRLDLANGLHMALQKGEFAVYYQLQADVGTNKVVGLEALLRWCHPNKGIISPLDFVPLLEEIGLISKVSLWLIHQSLKQLRRWINKGLLEKNAVISVNLSQRQFRDTDIVNALKKALSEENLKGENLVIEITENTLMQENPEMINVLKVLQEIGVRVALDDFGTGYASLSHLKKLPVDIIKIDRSFIKDIMTDEDDNAISKAIISLSHALDLEVIAEGVENKAILKKLKSLKCDLYQGYLLNEPLPFDEIENLLY